MRLTRRQFLVGGAVAAAATTTTAITIGPARRARALHALRLASSPDVFAPIAHVPLETGTLSSRHMPGPVRWAMSVPDGPILGAVYCLHCRNCDERFAFDIMRMPDIAAHVGVPLAFVAMDGGANTYWHRRADGRDPMAALVEDLVPIAERRLGPAAQKRAVIGWSMGGYGALLAAKQRPGLFLAMAAGGPAVFDGFRRSTKGSFDDEADYLANDVRPGPPPVPHRIDCGREDPFVDEARKLAGDVHVSRGFHDAAYWRSVAPAQLQVIAAALGA